MAKSIIRKMTEGQADVIKATGVGLRISEIAALDELGAELGKHLDSESIARNALMRLAIKRLLDAYEQGDLTLADLAEYFERPEKPQPKLKI